MDLGQSSEFHRSVLHYFQNAAPYRNGGDSKVIGVENRCQTSVFLTPVKIGRGVSEMSESIFMPDLK